MALEEPRIPEPPRGGVGWRGLLELPADAGFDVWQDEHWVLGIPAEPSGLPILAVLISRAHHDLEDLPAELAAELGPMIQRVARAVGSLEDVGRVHVNRWGDGGEHFHVWFLGRPKGMWQLRGALLAVWDDLLPKVPQEEWDRNRRAVATAMASGGGKMLADV